MFLRHLIIYLGIVVLIIATDRDKLISVVQKCLEQTVVQQTIEEIKLSVNKKKQEPDQQSPRETADDIEQFFGSGMFKCLIKYLEKEYGLELNEELKNNAY